MYASNQILEIIVLFIFTATVVGLITRRLRLPYTVGLVLMGLFLGLVNQPGAPIFPAFVVDLINQAEASITPELILGLLVTPLIFEAAFHLSWDDLRRDLSLILALAVPGVILTTVLVGAIIYSGTDFSLPVAMVFGALIAATDPVSVVALFRSLGVPKRLQVLLEGESLFNDGTAIVVFALVLGIARGSLIQGNASWIAYLTEFVRVVGGGLAIGLVLGWLASELIRRIDDHLIETTLTTLLAFSAYIIAERLQVSGVLTVVAAGLVNGNISPRGMSPTTRIVVSNFWEYAAFLSNSFVFLLIGLEMDAVELISRWQPILLAIIAVLVARAVVIYGLSWVAKDIPTRWNHILLWGGLRGAISLALALSLPSQLGPEIGTPLKVMAFGVVLFTILVQGFTMQPFVRKLRIIQRSELEEEYERRHARAVAARMAYERINEMYQEGLFSHHTWQLLSPLLEEHARGLAESVKEVIQADPNMEAEELDTARREALRAQRSALIGLLTGGVISEENYSKLAREIDMALSQSQTSWAGLINPMSLKPIHYLMTAVIQIQDYENALNALTNAGLSLTHLSSTGGFLGRRNITLLIGLGEGQQELAVQTLSKSCRRRVEYVATPLEGAPFNLPLSTPVTVGGATIFTLKVERYEEI